MEVSTEDIIVMKIIRAIYCILKSIYSHYLVEVRLSFFQVAPLSADFNRQLPLPPAIATDILHTHITQNRLH
jgi:hypothetical protein